MADTAFQTMYRQEFIAGFEKRQSLLRRTCVTEAEVNAQKATFLVADSGGATAVTRGTNGRIPSRPDNLTQPVVTLEEWHDKPERTGFNLFASQGDGRRIMQETSMAVINRKIDEQIHTALDGSGADTWGAATTATMTDVTIAKTKLANAFAGHDAPVFAAITPAFFGYLMGLVQFTSRDYINMPKFEGASKDIAFSWYGVNWIVDPELTGVGTSSAKCYMYSQNAMGHACDTDAIKTYVGYDEQDDYSWARCTTYANALVLQSAGIIQMLHDDSALS